MPKKCTFCGTKKKVREEGDEVYTALICDSEECNEEFGDNYVQCLQEQTLNYGEEG